MRRYRVELLADPIRCRAFLYVDAESEEEARKKIDERIHDCDDVFDDTDWEPDEMEGIEVVKITDVGGAPENTQLFPRGCIRGG